MEVGLFKLFGTMNGPMRKGVRNVRQYNLIKYGIHPKKTPGLGVLV